jgi:4-amino-4-deoxy-L-arabinose transferase-like glycosyltransferase
MNPVPTNLRTETPMGATVSKGRRVFLITSLAFLFRIFLIFAFQTYRVPDAPNHYGFGFETGSIAASLASGHGFGSPFGVPSGPTTWIAPVYPAIVAAAFKVFGLFSPAAAIWMLGFNSLCSALTVPLIYGIGKRVFNQASAELAAWIWALVPYFARWPVTWVWETALSALLCAVVFDFTLKMTSDAWRDWAKLGALWGAIALTSPSLLGFLPVSFLYPACKQRRGLRETTSRLLLAGAIFLVVISPWLARNEAAFHRPIFLRGNYWFEVSISNFENSSGELWSGLHPSMNKGILRRYIELGEPLFVAESKAKVFQFIRTHPAEFARFTAIRIAHFWNGGELAYESARDVYRPWMITLVSILSLGGLMLAVARGYQYGLFAWLLVLFPLPYYLASTNPRFRHPIEPMMVVLIGFFFVEVDRIRRERLMDYSDIPHGTTQK